MIHIEQMVSHGSGDTAAKLFYANLQYHVIKGSGNSMERNSLVHISTIPKLTSIDIVLMDI